MMIKIKVEADTTFDKDHCVVFCNGMIVEGCKFLSDLGDCLIFNEKIHNPFDSGATFKRCKKCIESIKS